MKVFVSGCFDMLHSGHIVFLNEAAKLGDLYVSVGNDKAVQQLKGKPPKIPEQERLFMVQSLNCIKEAFISKGTGLLDFIEDFHRIEPDIFYVNDEGDFPAKQHLCESTETRYIIGKRETPFCNRATSQHNPHIDMPFRLDLAGGWLDQPIINQIGGVSVVTVVSIEPDSRFKERCGLGSSTRNVACDLWRKRPRDVEYDTRFKQLYSTELLINKDAGSQDAVGIVYPGISMIEYEKSRWPIRVQSIQDEGMFRMIEQHIVLIPLAQREFDYDPMKGADITTQKAFHLQHCANMFALALNDGMAIAERMTDCFKAQVDIFPAMLENGVAEAVEKHGKQSAGYKITGAGGGGYLMCYDYQGFGAAIDIHVRRP